jgi:hypothetical protein
MPYYPVWSLTYVALGVLVVDALAAHGGEGSQITQSDLASM